VHQGSQRGDKAFVALNCAAIPENLIESELFGYRAGSFTGALKEGMRGKLQQADGGTLFLDEIGDMPLALQTRLLRVLEDRLVVPIGGEPQAVPGCAGRRQFPPGTVCRAAPRRLAGIPGGAGAGGAPGA